MSRPTLCLSLPTSVFYFFHRGSNLLQCEVRPALNDDGFEILINDGARERLEHHRTSEEVHRRWLELQEQFTNEGWWGPATQDGRG